MCWDIFSVKANVCIVVDYFCILSAYVTCCRKPLFRYCYECGRSVNVRLTPCSRCKEVYYCSKPCQNKAWETVHKKECLRIPAGLNWIQSCNGSRSARWHTSSHLTDESSQVESLVVRSADDRLQPLSNYVNCNCLTHMTWKPMKLSVCRRSVRTISSASWPFVSASSHVSELTVNPFVHYSKGVF